MSLATKRLLGLGLIAALVLAVVLGVAQPNPLADRYSYYAVFDTAQGLGPIDRDVRVAGVKIGEIGSVERIDDNVRTRLDLYEDYPVREDARVDMRPHTLFEGSNFVDLHPGSPSAPLMSEGDEIPLEQTSNYTTLDEALRILRPEIRENLRELAAAGSRTLRGKAIGGIQRTLRRAPRLTEALAPAARAAQGPSRRELSGAIAGMARTVDAVADAEQELIPAARRLNRTAAALTVEGGEPLDRALAALPGALAELERSAPWLDAAIERLDLLSGQISPHLSSLAAGLAETTPVLSRAIPVLEDGTSLIADTRRLTERLGQARGGLLRMFGLLEHPLVRFTDTLDLVNEPTVHGAPAYRQLVAGAFAGGAAVFNSYQTRAQNPFSPGHMLRIGVLFNPGALTAVTDLLGLDFDGALRTAPEGTESAARCDDVRLVHPAAADQLRRMGACS